MLRTAQRWAGRGLMGIGVATCAVAAGTAAIITQKKVISSPHIALSTHNTFVGQPKQLPKTPFILDVDLETTNITEKARANSADLIPGHSR